MKRVVTLFFLTGVMAACSSNAPHSQSDALSVNNKVASNDAASETNKQKLVCTEPPTGTRIARKKVCMTVEQQEELRKASKEATESAQARTQIERGNQ